MVLSVLIGTLICLPVLPKRVIRVKELPLPLQPTFLPGHLSQQGCPLGQGQGLEGWCAFSPAGSTRPENWHWGRPGCRERFARGRPPGCNGPGVCHQGEQRVALQRGVGGVCGRDLPWMGVETCTPHLPLHQPGLASAKVPPGLDEWSLGLPAFLEGSPAPHPPTFSLQPTTESGRPAGFGSEKTSQ